MPPIEIFACMPSDAGRKLPVGAGFDRLPAGGLRDLGARQNFMPPVTQTPKKSGFVTRGFRRAVARWSVVMVFIIVPAWSERGIIAIFR